MKNRQTKTTCYHYTAHRLDSVSYDDALSTVYHYNAYGQPDSVYDESGVMCYEYGNMGEVTKETRIYALPLLSQPIALSTLFEYDSWGRILNITYPDNEIVNYDYDLGGQLFRMYNNSSYTYLDNIIYDCFGAKTSQDYGNGIVTQYTYNDTTRRLSEIATNNGALINYTYDLVGNVTQVASTCPWLPNQSFTENFNYDSADQLTTAQENQNNGYQLTVNYGHWGKVNNYDLAQTDFINNTSTGDSRLFTYPSDPNNLQVAQTMFAPEQCNGTADILFSFGINGSLRKRETTQPQQHTEYYLFNSQGNLKAYSDDIMDFAYYGYNAANTRTYKLSLYNTNIWINGQQEPLNMQLQQAMFYPNTYLNFNGNGEYTKHYYNGTERIASRLGDNTTTIALNNNILEARKLQLEDQFREDIHKLIEETVPIDLPPFIDVNTLQPTGTPNDIYYYHPNHLGSTSFVTDQNQTITQGFLYAPFGEITTEYNINFGNNTIPKYAFNAKELDEETGMYYYEARYYAPPVFISRDVLFEEKPWFTPYHYCSNNPVVSVDPSGMLDSPIIDFDGNCLGTDADGWKGTPIVMDKKNFKQGMSHHDALEKGTELDKYGKGIKISDKTWSEIESKGGDDRLKPYVENKSNRTVYYKPEKSIGNYENDGAYPIEAGKDLYMPVDGIAAPHIIRNEVYKMPDGLKVRVNNFCVEPIKNSIKSIIAKFIPYKRGWNDERWHSYLKASCICFPTVSFPVEIPKRADHSWDNLFLKSQ